MLAFKAALVALRNVKKKRKSTSIVFKWSSLKIKHGGKAMVELMDERVDALCFRQEGG